MTHRGVVGDDVVAWDGTDENGSPLANGTYLFKLEAERRAADGSLENDEVVGKVVRMR
jgi:flagellar hook assembly protein FlgD